jgi:hypothetical protein
MHYHGNGPVATLRRGGNVFYTAAGSDCAAPPEMQFAGEVRWLDRYHARAAGGLAAHAVCEWTRAQTASSPQHHIDPNGIEGEDDEAIAGFLQKTGIEQRMNVAVDRLDIAVHPPRRFADAQRSGASHRADHLPSLRSQKSKKKLWGSETDARTLLPAFEGASRPPLHLFALCNSQFLPSNVERVIRGERRNKAIAPYQARPDSHRGSPIKANHSSSVSTVTPASAALVSLEPAPGPATR